MAVAESAATGRVAGVEEGAAAAAVAAVMVAGGRMRVRLGRCVYLWVVSQSRGRRVCEPLEEATAWRRGRR